ncbi:MAG: hypothetical protein U1E86_24505 [Burkholderiaceae bacterium]
MPQLFDAFSVQVRGASVQTAALAVPTAINADNPASTNLDQPDFIQQAPISSTALGAASLDRHRGPIFSDQRVGRKSPHGSRIASMDLTMIASPPQ